MPADDGPMRARFFAALALLLAHLPAVAGGVDVSGHITSHLTGEALAGVRVGISVLTAFGAPVEVGAAISDGDGFYEWRGHCQSVFGTCDASIDHPPYLPAGALFDDDQPVSVIDFALLTPATASGTLRFAGGDTTGMYVTAERFFAESGLWAAVGAAPIEADGRFVIGALPPDTYHFCTDYAQNGAIRQCFDHRNLPPLAGVVDATPVDVPEGSAVDGIDFDLVYGGTLSGTVYDAYRGAPMTAEQAQVVAYDINGHDLLYASTDASGAFHLHGLPDGSYYLGLSLGGPWTDGVQFYPGIVCTMNACPPPTSGTLFTIAGGNEISGLDFTVHPDVVVRGRVFDADSGDPLGIDVGLYFYDGARMTSSDPDTGDYVFYWYSDKTFEVGAFNASPYIDGVYPDASCLRERCIGTPATLSAASGTVLDGIDIPMKLGAAMTGHLTRADNGAPGNGYVELYDEAFNEIWAGDTLDASYATAPWLPGTYYVKATGYWPLTGCAFYDDRPCPENGGDPAGVDPTPIVLTAGEIRTGVDFHLPAAEVVFSSGFDFF